ncbi:hypothetical protein Patl_2023 [Paraglaciecola sp. T6c]|uniref:hypothetical protein n=1 Tax=Pseudoalteromonas atlantica (strain T6c / ATCC BAA-1087) TaxID=3042615 RepID=UPI00005C63DE|nr:hypothetical protein [Paraglaciecola sp. T6c]ABG40541.1 hypothetical protein Patl_2023 [Paraglaciecola sp. T6c]
MITLRQFISKAIERSLRKSDREYLATFDEYCFYTSISDMPLHYFGDFEFLQFHAYLQTFKPLTAIYNCMTAVRRLMTSEHNEGFEFKIHPRYFSCPPKPSPSHFEPLDEEKLEKLESYLKREIETIYQRETTCKEALRDGQPIQETGETFKKTHINKSPPSFWKWQKTLNDCVYQIYLENPKFPNDASEEQFKDGGEYAVIRRVDYDLLDTPYKLIFKRLGVQRLKNSVPFLADASDLNFIDIFGLIYPRIFEVYIITWAICLETGWSQDMVERINYNDYLYCPIPIDSDFAFIKTTKQKGVNGNNDIKEAKQFIHPSSKTNPFSAYNLIRLFVERSSRLRTGRNYDNLVIEINTEPFFIYYNESSGTPILARHPDRVAMKTTNTRKRFMESQLGFCFDVRQLRPTCLYLREKNQNLPLLLQVALFGHSSSAITDEFYKDSAPFQQVRKDKLAIELKGIQESIDDGSFKGTLAPLKQKKKIKDKIITIFTDHSGESPLAVCKDNRSPDWPGFELELGTNGVCRRFNKCLLCSRSIVFSDNIPFVVDRYLYLDQQKRKLRANAFESVFMDEYLAAKEVIDSWPYPEDIEEAEERTILNDFLLPPIISESF